MTRRRHSRRFRYTPATTAIAPAWGVGAPVAAAAADAADAAAHGHPLACPPAGQGGKARR